MVKDLIFPVFCLSCQKEGHWLCPDCLEKLKKEIKPHFFCPHCYQDNSDGRTCPPSQPALPSQRGRAGEAGPACRPFSFLDRTMALASYENKTIAKMIHLLKYSYVEEMAEVFEKLMENFLDKFGEESLTCHSRESGNPEKFKLLPDPPIKSGDDRESGITDQHSSFNIPHSSFIILPIPLHRQRHLERGFNQAGLLAKVWSKHLGWPVQPDILVRGRPTKTQVGLGRAERQQNLLGAFKLKKPLPSQKVILVDDVFTTGSTLQEAGRVLKEAGAKEVWGVTMARER